MKTIGKSVQNADLANMLEATMKEHNNYKPSKVRNREKLHTIK